MESKSNLPTELKKKELKTALILTAESKTVFIKNNLLQKIMINAIKPDGSNVGIEIEAKGKRPWPRMDDYGPHVEALRKRGTLSITT